MKRKLRGSFTVEAAFIIPFILFLFGVLMQVLFYYHDKNILMAATQDAARYGCSRIMPEEKEIKEHFQERISGRLLLFSKIKSEVKIEDDKVAVHCQSEKNSMSIETESVVNRTRPENLIRGIRKLEKIGGEVGDYIEDVY